MTNIDILDDLQSKFNSETPELIVSSMFSWGRLELCYSDLEILEILQKVVYEHGIGHLIIGTLPSETIDEETLKNALQNLYRVLIYNSKDILVRKLSEDLYQISQGKPRGVFYKRNKAFFFFIYEEENYLFSKILKDATEAFLIDLEEFPVEN